jgi:hypothetical protein
VSCGLKFDIPFFENHHMTLSIDVAAMIHLLLSCRYRDEEMRKSISSSKMSRADEQKLQIPNTIS